MATCFEIDLRHNATGRTVTVRQDKSRIWPVSGFDDALPWDEKNVVASLKGYPNGKFEIVGDVRLIKLP